MLIEKILNQNNSNPTESFGIVKPCIFNQLQYFNILQNWSVDLMHDVQEGVVPHFVEIFIKYCDQIGIKQTDIIKKIRDFDYGPLSKKNKPSLIGMKKSHLGQSAIQTYCLIQNLPFIIMEYQEKLSNAWKPLTTLLSIMQIIYSTKITESNILKLEDLISDHLIELKHVFNDRLIFKHHILLHYPTVIRTMGPPIHTTMMRIEAKHKIFTDLARKTQNFMNITKTLANRHQEHTCQSKFNFSDQIEIPKICYFLKDCDEYTSLIGILSNDSTLNVNSLKKIKICENQRLSI